MKFSDITTEAKKCLKNNYWKLFIVMILNYVISFAFTAVSESFETSILSALVLIFSYVITIPLAYGVTVSFIKSSREESISVFDFLSDGMKSFKRVWAVFGRTILKLILPIIAIFVAFIASVILVGMCIFGKASPVYLFGSSVLMIVGVVYYISKALSYSLTNYILYDNPDMSAKEVVEESKVMMTGNKWTLLFISLFVCAIYVVLLIIASLIASFANSFISVYVTAIIALIGAAFLMPYAMALQVAFYNILKNKDSVNDNSENN